MINSRRLLTIKFKDTATLAEMRQLLNCMEFAVRNNIELLQQNTKADVGNVEVFVVDSWRRGIFKIGGRGPTQTHAEIATEAIICFDCFEWQWGKLPHVERLTLTIGGRR